MNNLSITPGKNNVGAYINNIDLKNLEQNQVDEIKNTLSQFGVIFIKNQKLDPFLKKTNKLFVYLFMKIPIKLF